MKCNNQRNMDIAMSKVTFSYSCFFVGNIFQNVRFLNVEYLGNNSSKREEAEQSFQGSNKI